MANVKHTTNNGERLTTNCKKVATALKRFAEFLGNYDRCYNDMLNNIKSANDNNTTTFTDDRYNTITMTLTANDNNDSYTLTIKHTHNAPKTIWSICNQDGTIKDFDDRKDLFEYAYKNNLYGKFETIWIEEKELKDEKHDYYETVDYEELDLYKIRTCLEFDICDMKVNNTNDTKDTESDTKDTESDTKDTESDTNATEYTLDNIKDRYAIKDDATDKCHYVYTKTWCKDDKKRVYIKDYKNRSIGYIDAVNGDIKINDRQGIYADELDYALINIIADMTKNHATDNTNKQDSNNKTPADLKADINNKYGVNAVYYDTDSILCDDKKQNVYVAQHNTNDNETKQLTYNIKAYYDGKELTVPCDKYKCKQYALEYIKALYENHDVEYETLFIIYYGKHAETKTIDNVLDVTDLIEYNIDDINNGLKNDCYKKVCEGFERICSIITDDIKVCIDLHNGNNVNYCTITSTDNKGYYGFKYVKSTYIKKPSDFARWLYFKTFVRCIELKCWYRDLRGETT